MQRWPTTHTNTKEPHDGRDLQTTKSPGSTTTASTATASTPSASNQGATGSASSAGSPTRCRDCARRRGKQHDGCRAKDKDNRRQSQEGPAREHYDPHTRPRR